jgi:Flp pilus assembly protein TadG
LRRSEEGAVAIIVALCLTVLLVAAGLVVDFGLVRIDRQVDKSAADSATLAGLHGLNGGDGNAHPYMGVCTAVRYLKENNARFAGINESVGWTDGNDVGTASGCSDSTLRAKTCIPGDPSSWAKFTWNGTWSGMPLVVTIQSGYSLTGSTWSEDTLDASRTDDSDGAQGCDQMAVIVTQSRDPGLGSLATSSDLRTTIRTVGRVEQRPGGAAPALLLLEPHDCPVLGTGSASADTSWIHVYGSLASNGATQAGTIHADSDATGDCTGGSNEQILWGRQSNGIVAYAAPLATNPALPDATQPGSITTVAGADGKATNYIYDGLTNVYASGALGPAAAATATKTAPTGRSAIGRTLVDQRYRSTVRSAMLAADGVFAAGSAGYVTFPPAVDACKPTQANVNALRDPDGTVLDATSKVWIDCPSPGRFNPTGNLSIPAGTIVINSVVAPDATLSLPDAHHVYVAGQPSKPNAIDLNSSGQFQMNTNGNLSGSSCSVGQNPDKAVLFLKQGSFKEANTANLVRMCRTTVFLMSGQADGCVPTVDGAQPTSSPCTSGLGSGQFTQNGGSIDWTAPDTMDITTDSDGNALPAATAAWSDPNGPEDLALWSESSANNSTTFSMTGGGLFSVRGVFMTPNAVPFQLGGGAFLNLTNAQFIARTIQLNGSGTKIDMRVDPNSAVTLPKLELVGLVR